MEAREDTKITRMSQTHVGRSYYRLAAVTCCALGSALLTGIGHFPALLAGIGGAALGCWALRRHMKRTADPTHQLMLGLLLLIIGMVLNGGAWGALCAVACGSGAVLCGHALIGMTRAFKNASRFLLGEAGGDKRVRDEWILVPLLVGVLLGGVCPRIAWLLPCAALVFAFDFPLSTRWINKLVRWFELSAEGRDTPERRKQLEERLIPRKQQPFLLHFLESVCHVFYHHKAQGRENVHPDDENPIVYLCNHGDLHGPIAAWLTIPTEKRPWSIAYISTTVETAEAYLYKYDWSVKTWMPDKLRHLMAHIIAWFAVWATQNLLEAVPVWRDSPRQLINTFRLTVEALQCGDNLLIFPENPNASGVDHGYEREGLGELFSGFAMLAQIYYNKTGKRCRFLPMFAHQKTRTVRFGTEIVYDPQNDPTDERNRISDEAAAQMLAMYHDLEASR